MNNGSKVDHFSRLPNELVQAIADRTRLQASDKPFPRLSRRFLPFYRSSLYKFVEISELARFAKFLRCLRNTPSHHLLIEELDLYLPTFGQRNPQTDQTEGLTEFFASVLNLRKLVLKGNSFVCAIFTTLPHPVTPRLEHLHLQLTYHSTCHSASLPTSFFDRLTSYPNLTHLGLVRLAARPRASALEATDPIRFPSLTSLEIGGPIVNYKAYRNLLRRCSPTALVIAEDADTGEWNPYSVPKLLSTIHEPHLVKKLVLDLAKSIPISVDLNLPLSTLVNLEDLTLIRRATPFDINFYDVLAKLPLRQLTFGPGSSGLWEILRDIILDMKEPRKLQLLTLDILSATRGNESDPTLEKDGYSWALADWTDNFDLDDCKSLIALGQKLGIEVRGTAVEAVAIEDEHRELLKRWKEENPDEDSGTSEAEEDEYVEEEEVEGEVEGMVDEEEGESEVEEERTPEREESDGHSEGYYYRTP